MKALRRYIGLHGRSLADAFGRLGAQPFSTLLTVLVIAIALALPAGLRVLVGNVAALSGQWQAAADFSAYLVPDADEVTAREIAATIDARADVESVTLITRDAALEDFRARSGLGDAVDALGSNPLPHTLVVRPAGGVGAGIEAIAAALAELPAVDRVQLDTEWVERLRAILALVARVVDVVTVMLAAGVVLVIGNTIRLEINNRATEIEVIKLVGGTDAFIRRPFLYLGLLQGLAGALIAAVLIIVTMALLRAPALALADLYGSAFRPTGLRAVDAAVLLGGGALLGWAGAALATARHLRAIEPR